MKVKLNDLDYEAIGRKFIEILRMCNKSTKMENNKQPEKQMAIDFKDDEKQKKTMRLHYRQMKGYEVSIYSRDKCRNITFSSKITDDIEKNGFYKLEIRTDEVHRIVHFIISLFGVKTIRMTGSSNKNAIISSKEIVDNVRNILSISPAIKKEIMTVMNYNVDKENGCISFDLMK